MKIIVLNGSPKIKYSITLKYIEYIIKKFPEHNFKIYHVAKQIQSIEKDEKFTKIMEDIKASDAVIWSFPVYYILVPSNYKRFIELIFERNGQQFFQGKYAAILSTSIRYYDHTAHNYIHGICDDLEMKFLGTYSAHMSDLKRSKERSRLINFFKYFAESIQAKIEVPKMFQKINHEVIEYKPGNAKNQIKLENKKITLITDCTKEDSNLEAMIKYLTSKIDINVKNLNDVNIKTTCQGCIHCGYDNTCLIKDGFTDFYNNEIKQSDIIIYAATIKDRYLSSLWKKYFDRAFFNNHVPTLKNKQVGYIFSGPLKQIPNLKQLFNAYLEFHKANLIGFVTDEHESSKDIDSMIDGFVWKILYFSKNEYRRPVTFLGDAGMRVFRDHIYSYLKFPFRSDYKYYKKAGFFRFPSWNWYNSLLILLTKIPFIREKIYKKMLLPKMIESYKKTVEKY